MREEDLMAITSRRALKAVLGLVVSISVRSKFCFLVALFVSLVAINTNAAEVTYTPPIPIEPKEAVYPVNSVARGTVVVIVVVEKDGLVSKAKVLKSVDSLDEPSVYAAKQWRFEPARLDGQPIRSGASISFVYDRGLFPPTEPKK
jgi:TonB family protein